jgi:hypothetical protein
VGVSKSGSRVDLKSGDHKEKEENSSDAKYRETVLAE